MALVHVTAGDRRKGRPQTTQGIFWGRKPTGWPARILVGRTEGWDGWVRKHVQGECLRMNSWPSVPVGQSPRACSAQELGPFW